ncbi:galactokinase [Anaerotruncus rubiinfantis]|uniref:galactokinase n=1 Tax=Anaerotruncus rubiinfantis TaxID=1720200 RepID=UPI00189AD28D|nr:galactokinase family protein [Anaerotruncus rubiinfantis]
MKLISFRQQLKDGHYNGLFTKLYGAKSVEQATGRYLNALQGFEAAFPTHDDIAVFSTPGRTEIGGNHTDHNAGFVLAGAVNLDIISIVAGSDSTLVRLKSEGFDPYLVDLTGEQPVEEERYTSAALVRGVAARMRQLGHKVGGFDCYTTSSVPNGAGLSSSAAFEVQICTILNHLYNAGVVDDVTNAQIAQYAENYFFGKPCGLMDQTACAVGGLLQIDFNDFDHPIVEQIQFDFAAQNHILYLVKTGGSHADLNEDYTALENEMKQTARLLGQPVLRFTSKEAMFQNLAELREKGNDRAVLRSYHYFNDNQRVLQQADALRKGDFDRFKALIIESGYSSFMYCQNVYTNSHWQEQGVSIALMVAEDCLQGKGAWRVHGGGFAGTIQAFVPDDLAAEFEARMKATFGDDACHRTMIRPYGTLRVDSQENR